MTENSSGQRAPCPRCLTHHAERMCPMDDLVEVRNSSEQRDEFEDALKGYATHVAQVAVLESTKEAYYEGPAGRIAYFGDEEASLLHSSCEARDAWLARLRAARVPPATDAELEEGLAEFEAAINRKWAADLVHNEMKDEPTRIQFEMRTAQVAECGARIRALFSLLSAECESYKTLSHELDQQGYTREQVRRAVRHFVERWSGGPIADSVIDKGLSQLEDDGDGS